MEFPDLGQQCSVTTCKQLDFLPIKCDACNNIFCNNHFKYDSHTCPSSYMKNNQVPICPLCNRPVPTKRGQPPDIGVSYHIDYECLSDPAQNKRKTNSARIYTNKCSLKNCKNKEIMPLVCNQCNKNYCLRHRHTSDHDCLPVCAKSSHPNKSGSTHPNKTGGLSFINDISVRGKAATAALFRQQQNNQSKGTQSNNKSKPSPREIQGNLSEDEALARALQQSMVENTKHTSSTSSSNLQDIEDRLLAQAIATSEKETNKNKDKCNIS